jgi:hypothetical protein
MNIIAPLACALTALFMAVTADAQVKGTVTDTDGKPVRDAVVRLSLPGDTAKYHNALSSEGGIFSLRSGDTGRYNLSVTCAGFMRFTQIVQLTGAPQDLGSFLLTHDVRQLQDVTVKGQKKLIDQRTDMTVLNVDEEVRKVAPNGLEILKITPGIDISDNEDALTMSGKENVDVMIDGRITHLEGRDLLKFLKSLPAGSISQVEVMTNPSSKYDVKGNTGILNIRTKRPASAGVTGSVSADASQATTNMGDLSAGLNIGTTHLAINPYLAYHWGDYPSWYNEDRYIATGSGSEDYHQYNLSHEKWSDPQLRVGADYYINQHHTISAIVDLEHSTNHSLYSSTTSLLGTSRIPDSTYYTSSYAPNSKHWDTYNLDYRYADAANEFVFDIDRSFYRKTSNNALTNSVTDSLGNNWTQAGSEQDLATKIDILTFKADFTRKWGKGWQWEAGAKVSVVNTDNNLYYLDVSGVAVKPDSNYSNHFLYKERVNALYADISRHEGKWGYQLGLRVEHSHVEGTSTGLEGSSVHKPDSSYINFLPSLYITYAPGRNHALRFSATEKIKRPNYENLQPFTYQVDQFDYHSGNPYLVPQKDLDLELNYTYKGNASATLSYVHTEDFFNPIVNQVGNVFVETVDNTGNQDQWNLSLNYPVKFTKWWSSTNRASVFYSRYAGVLYEGYLDEGGWGATVYSAQRFVLPGENIFTVTGRYNSPYRQLIYQYQDNGSLGASIGRRIFHGHGIIRVGVTDVFLTQRNTFEVHFGDLQYNQDNRWESRRVNADFSLDFGHAGNNIKKTRSRQTGNAEEKGRAGQ